MVLPKRIDNRIHRLVADQFAATVRDNRQADLARAVLLAATGGEPPGAAAVLKAWCGLLSLCPSEPDGSGGEQQLSQAREPHRPGKPPERERTLVIVRVIAAGWVF